MVCGVITGQQYVLAPLPSLIDASEKKHFKGCFGLCAREGPGEIEKKILFKGCFKANLTSL